MCGDGEFVAFCRVAGDASAGADAAFLQCLVGGDFLFDGGDTVLLGSVELGGKLGGEPGRNGQVMGAALFVGVAAARDAAAVDFEAGDADFLAANGADLDAWPCIRGSRGGGVEDEGVRGAAVAVVDGEPGRAADVDVVPGVEQPFVVS